MTGRRTPDDLGLVRRRQLPGGAGIPSTARPHPLVREDPGVSDLKRVRCPRCRSAESDAVVSGHDYLHQLPGEFFAAECRDCGLWFQNPRPPTETLASLYPDDYRPHVASDRRSTRRRRCGRPWLVICASASDTRSPGGTRRPRVRLALAAVARSGAAVDCRRRVASPVRPGRRAAGHRLRERQPPGVAQSVWMAAAERHRARRGRGRGSPGERLSPSSAVPWSRRSNHTRTDRLDVVVSSMVLEHLPDPFEVVRQIAAKLKPGGQFLFSTVVRDSLDARIYGKFWGGFDFPRHLVYFRRADLDAMLAGQYEQAEYFYQSAPIDFLRSSSWRRRAGEGRIVDRIIVGFLSMPRAAWLAGFVLAWFGRTSRVSCRCRRTA